jgi:predicted secreted protein
MADVNDSLGGEVVFLAISTDLVTPAYKNVVCSSGDIGVAGSTEGGATANTRCGVAKGGGRSSWQITGEGVHNTNIAALTEVSANEMAALFQNRTSVLVRVQDETTPANYYRQGQGKITEYEETSNVDGFVTFSFTIEIAGDLDLAV